MRGNRSGRGHGARKTGECFTSISGTRFQEQRSNTLTQRPATTTSDQKLTKKNSVSLSNSKIVIWQMKRTVMTNWAFSQMDFWADSKFPLIGKKFK